jgi:hypothetical protein
MIVYEFVYKCRSCEGLVYDKLKCNFEIDEEGIMLWFTDRRTNHKLHVCNDNVVCKRHSIADLISVDLMKEES